MAGFPNGFALTVHRPGGSDRYGNPLPASDHTVDGCAAAPAGSTEYVNGQATVVDRDTVYGPYGADVAAGDTVEIPAGQPVAAGTYQVDGNPQHWKNPFSGWEAGCTIRLTQATG